MIFCSKLQAKIYIKILNPEFLTHFWKQREDLVILLSSTQRGTPNKKRSIVSSLQLQQVHEVKGQLLGCPAQIPLSTLLGTLNKNKTSQNTHENRFLNC
jgi:hypothetical protein